MPALLGPPIMDYDEDSGHDDGDADGYEDGDG